MRLAPLLLAVWATVACEGDPVSAPPPPDPSGGGGSDTGSSAGGGGSGGEAPQGGGAPADGGAGASDAAASGALSLERLDSGGDCAGLVPERVPAPVVVRRDAAAGAACGAGISDGTGALALAATGEDGTSFAVHGPDGAPRGTFRAEPGVIAQPDGFSGLVVARPARGEPRVEHVAFTAQGVERRRATVSPDPAARTAFRWDLAADPAGGALVVFRSTNVFGNHWSEVTVHRFDAAGAPRWPGGVALSTDEAPTEPLFLGGGVSTRGDALVVAQDSAFLDASWLDGEGHGVAAADRGERSDAVVGEGLSHELDLVPLLDGSVAVRSDGTFRRAYAPLATASEPLPPWLEARAAATVRFTRGNAGYAVLPPAGEASADCTQRIDLVSPSGRLCGRAVLREEGAGCTTRAVEQGWDGTVVQQSALDACTYRVWPRLLAGE